MPDFLASERFQRGFMWLAALVLVAGAVAFLTMRLGGRDNEASAEPPPNAPPAVTDTTMGAARSTRVARAARVAAGQFILAAAGREDLKKAWRLTHPDLRSQCDCSYKQWLTGNIPVQYYPVGGLDLATFSVEEASPNHAVLLVALIPKKGEDVKPQTFFIGVRKHGKGAQQRWLVDYWAPYSVTSVPDAGSGSH